ncbi:MAG: TraB/GumN family protein [Erysipelotrichaceae bacterium]|nr:TraB/GumN family protein [Erysipelotrichaceae bacterium]
MEKELTQIQINDKEITIIGTAHVSKYSAEEVREIIEQVQPDCICIELDDQRFQNLKNPKKFSDMDIVQVIKDKKVGSLLVNIILSSYQKRTADKLKATAGMEMMEGIKCAEELGCDLRMIDRNIQTTFSRIWRSHSFIQKCKLVSSLILSIFDDEEITEEDIENLKQSDMLDAALKEVSKEFPVVARVLIHERDEVLAQNMKTAPGNKIVAVVGAAHVPGILQAIHQEIDVNELCSVPEKTLLSKLSGWIIPILIIGMIGYTMLQSTQMGLDQIKSWFLWNGTLSAIGTLLCASHPLTVLTALIAAPFTSLNPLLAAGWFAGLAEALIRKPKVSDFENLTEDVATFKGFYKNRVTHILLVVIMANLFSTIGTIISGLDIVKTFFSAL